MTLGAPLVSPGFSGCQVPVSTTGFASAVPWPFDRHGSTGLSQEEQ
jgi:hypothetical protein